ncbi:MAG: hypothetical protein M0P69_01610 [Bacteroidales bacterium]|nr:hypothetical protein [Bacteroidales bacterium]
MKLSDVVRGVEVRKIGERGDNYDRVDYINGGYNSLASAEVVVDSRAIANVINDMDLDRWDSDEALAQAIATAIESGAVLSLKKED